MSGPVVCAICQAENLEGEDSCTECGADLRTVDIPEQADGFVGRMLGEHLDALISGSPPLIDANEPAGVALARMREIGTDCMLVMSAGRLVGIFTERDAVLKLAGRQIAAFDVRDVMTSDPVVLRDRDTIAVAIHKMAVGGFRHIPVIDGGRPIGVLAARDVFRHVVGLME